MLLQPEFESSQRSEVVNPFDYVLNGNQSRSQPRGQATVVPISLTFDDEVTNNTSPPNTYDSGEGILMGFESTITKFIF